MKPFVSGRPIFGRTSGGQVVLSDSRPPAELAATLHVSTLGPRASGEAQCPRTTSGGIRAGCSTSSGSKIASPRSNFLRRMNVFVTAALAALHKELKPYYSDNGRPSIDPELMIRMLIIGCLRHPLTLRLIQSPPQAPACELRCFSS